MSRRILRRQAQWLYRHIIDCGAAELGDEDLKRSAIVFSPHFDDETLGCGGTIVKKKSLGAEVKIVFMTDGSKSHAHLISVDELKAMRKSEGLAAAEALGLDSQDVTFLGFEDSRLKEHATEAASRVGAILKAEQPLDVFVPYFRDPMPDHAAAHGIVMAALRRHGERTGVYEYPVWFWRHWPWTGGPHLKCRGVRLIAQESAACMVRFLRESRRRVRIGDVADDKRAALEQHRSQMTRLGSNPQWQILDDVWEGDFLRCFFNEYERFVKREFCPG